MFCSILTLKGSVRMEGEIKETKDTNAVMPRRHPVSAWLSTGQRKHVNGHRPSRLLSQKRSSKRQESRNVHHTTQKTGLLKRPTTAMEKGEKRKVSLSAQREITTTSPTCLSLAKHTPITTPQRKMTLSIPIPLAEQVEEAPRE